ncbi:hypothetical protein V1478_016691 [Vespula squamosa]|uniref:Uncharacterized protein n=1 Tax=Vespula squamosa TaxID=30214 RepID=A0ABD2A0H0_VESSQ
MTLLMTYQYIYGVRKGITLINARLRVNSETIELHTNKQFSFIANIFFLMRPPNSTRFVERDTKFLVSIVLHDQDEELRNEERSSLNVCTNRENRDSESFKGEIKGGRYQVLGVEETTKWVKPH